MTSRPLARNTLFRAVVSGTDPGLTGGLLIGVLCGAVLPSDVPRSALQLLTMPQYDTFLIVGQDVYHNTEKVSNGDNLTSNIVSSYK